MRIHTTETGESTADIAVKYGIDEAILCLVNEIDKNTRLSVGEELLILTPTRTYTATKGDSMMRVALRFGRPVSELRGLNPHITTDTIPAGQTVIVKCDERPYGMGVSNGIYYRGCPIWKLMRALPYTTYITVGSGIFDGKKCYESFSGKEIVNIAVENGKMPLIRVYDKSGGALRSGISSRIEYIDSLIELATECGYKGIDLGYKGENIGESYEEFLVELRSRMIGSDLILISEILPDSDRSIADYSDGAILSFDRCADADNHMSFNDWEGAILQDFADNSESTKTFIELPAFANSERQGYIEIADALDIARRHNAVTEIDKNTFISKITNKKHGSIIYNSLSGIKARMDMLADLGYMGISFDIARCPLSYLMMYDSLFKSVGYANVDRAVKCNPDSSETGVI